MTGAPAKPRSIALLVRSLDGIGGAERQVSVLAAGLHRRGWRVVMIPFYSGGPREQELRDQGIAVHGLAKTGRRDTVPSLLRLVRILRREQPDVVHGYNIDANLFAAMLKPLLRGAIVWGVRASDVDYARYRRSSRALFAANTLTARLADLVICNSAAGAAHHRALGYPAERLVVIPNGIDTERFRPDAAARRELRAEWNVPDDAPLIGIVARFDPMKDHETFLRAASLLAARMPAARFVCVGAGAPAYAGHLRDLAASLGLDARLRWEPTVARPERVYNALDILTLCSAYGEGHPNVVGEAMACGTACVVTDVGDAASLVGDPRFVVPKRDPDALADRWASVLREGPHRDSDARRERIIAEFSVERLIDRSERALEALIA